MKLAEIITDAKTGEVTFVLTNHHIIVWMKLCVC